MANSIALFKKYVDLLDDVYKNAACSSVLVERCTIFGGSFNHYI